MGFLDLGGVIAALFLSLAWLDGARIKNLLRVRGAFPGLVLRWKEYTNNDGFVLWFTPRHSEPCTLRTNWVWLTLSLSFTPAAEAERSIVPPGGEDSTEKQFTRDRFA